MKKYVVFYAIFLTAIFVSLCGCGKEPQQSKEVQIPEGVVIALLDTGVSETAITSDRLLDGYNYVEDSTDTEDHINHGTAVASAILGCESAGVVATAPDAYVVPLVVMTKIDGEVLSVKTEVLAQAIREATDVYEADIINISLGIQKDDDVLQAAVEYATKQGVLVVSAVGNGGAEGKSYYPASYDCVLAVGSHDEDGIESDFSQPGADVLAPGEDVWLASRNGVTYGTRGTSYATGFVSAEAANYLLQNERLSVEELTERIIAE